MTHSCRHWFESDYGEKCRAVMRSCTCSGLLTQCDYPQYYNLSDEAVKNQKGLDSINRTKAEVESFNERGGTDDNKSG